MRTATAPAPDTSKHFRQTPVMVVVMVVTTSAGARGRRGQQKRVGIHPCAAGWGRRSVPAVGELRLGLPQPPLIRSPGAQSTEGAAERGEVPPLVRGALDLPATNPPADIQNAECARRDTPVRAQRHVRSGWIDRGRNQEAVDRAVSYRRQRRREAAAPSLSSAAVCACAYIKSSAFLRRGIDHSAQRCHARNLHPPRKRPRRQVCGVSCRLLLNAVT